MAHIQIAEYVHFIYLAQVNAGQVELFIKNSLKKLYITKKIRHW